MGSESSWIAGRLFLLLTSFVDEHDLGLVWPADNGYQCFPDSPNTVHKPDVSFIRRGRLPGDVPSAGYETVSPDLVVEVVSPNEGYYEVERKVDAYLKAGVPLVWVVTPTTRTVTIYRADGSTARLHDTDELTGNDVLPGFHCRVADIFPPKRQTGERGASAP